MLCFLFLQINSKVWRRTQTLCFEGRSVVRIQAPKLNRKALLSFLASDDKGPIPLGMTDLDRKYHLPYSIKKVDLVV